jgi:hypothetical protein
MAWRIAGLKSRTRNIEDVLLRVALNCLWVHRDPPCRIVQAKFQPVKYPSRSLPRNQEF